MNHADFLTQLIGAGVILGACAFWVVALWALALRDDRKRGL